MLSITILSYSDLTSLRVFEVVHDQSEDDGLLTLRTVFGQISDAKIPFCKINSALDFPQPIKYRACSVYVCPIKDMEQLLQLQAMDKLTCPLL